MNRLRLKYLVVLLTGIVGTIGLMFSGPHVSIAGKDDILSAIAGYKNWTRINKAPISVADLSTLRKITVSLEPSAFVIEGAGG